jgi:hypothetical protein
MPVELPDKPIEPTMFSPERLLLYGPPKIGKTDILTWLPDTLILEGTPRDIAMYRTRWLPITDYKQFMDTGAAVMAKMARNREEGKLGKDVYPYRFMAIDTMTDVEDIIIRHLTTETIAREKKRPADKQNKDVFDPLFSVMDLPYGAGVELVRNKMLNTIDSISMIAPRSVYIAHVKDKLIGEIANQQVKVEEIALMGKLPGIVASRMDAIGFLFRDKDNKLMVSFNTPGEKSSMKSRFKWLAGKTIPFSWEAIFPDEFGLPVPEN